MRLMIRVYLIVLSIWRVSKRRTKKSSKLIVFIQGVSGSTWAMSQFYSPLTHASVETLKDHLSSRIHTHIANLSNFLTILNASRHNAKILLHGVIQRYYQQNGSISLVDIFGMLLGGTLLTKKVIVDSKKKEKADEEEEYSESISLAENTKIAKTGTVEEDDGAKVRPRVLQKNEVKLSKQKKYFEDGSLPMPVYCAVRHEIHRPGITKQATMSSIPEERDEEENEKKEGKEENPKDLYQWYEFTPYEMGSEEINGKEFMINRVKKKKKRFELIT